MKYMKKLVGQKVYLSPFNMEDASLCTEWLNDFNTTDYVGHSSHVYTIDKEKERLEILSREEAFFEIITLNDDKPIGTITLSAIDHVDRIATLGILIGDKNSREKGFGTDAIKLILDYGFSYLNLNSINLTVLEFNQAAIKCYKKCGFKDAGRLRKSRFVNGKYYDQLKMDILAEEFRESYIKNKNI